jgi:hypothetical protein
MREIKANASLVLEARVFKLIVRILVLFLFICTLRCSGSLLSQFLDNHLIGHGSLRLLKL